MRLSVAMTSLTASSGPSSDWEKSDFVFGPVRNAKTKQNNYFHLTARILPDGHFPSYSPNYPVSFHAPDFLPHLFCGPMGVRNDIPDATHRMLHLATLFLMTFTATHNLHPPHFIFPTRLRTTIPPSAVFASPFISPVEPRPNRLLDFLRRRRWTI